MRVKVLLLVTACTLAVPVAASAQRFEVGPGGVRVDDGRGGRDYDRRGGEDYGRDRGGRGGETCAREGGFCEFRGEANVRYGARGRYTMRRARDGIPCNNRVFGDPAPGLTKRCVID